MLYQQLYGEIPLEYSKNPHIRTYSYGLSLIRFLLAIQNLVRYCTGMWNETVLFHLFNICLQWKLIYQVFEAIVLVSIIMNEAISACIHLTVEGSYMPGFTVCQMVVAMNLSLSCKTVSDHRSFLLAFFHSTASIFASLYLTWMHVLVLV